MINHTCKNVIKFAFVGLSVASLTMSNLTYANKFTDSAEKHLKNNEVNAAVIELKNAIQSSPKEALPRLMLGQIYLQKGSFPSAEKELARALSLEGNRDQIAPLLARTLLNLNQNDAVIDLADEYPLSSQDSQAEMLALKALAQLNLGNLSAAEKSIEMAQKSGHPSLYLAIAKARVQVAKGDTTQALQNIQPLLDEHPDNSDLWLFHGHLNTNLRDFNQASASYMKAYEISPDAFLFTVYIARSLVYDLQFNEAEPYIDELLKRAPNHALSNELKASIRYASNDYYLAKEHADRALHNGSNDTATMLVSGVSAYQLKLYEQAYKMLQRVSPNLPADHYAKRLIIALQLQLGYVDDAVSSLGQLDITSDENSQFMSQASFQIAKLGRDEQALEIAQKAAQNSSSNNELMLGMVKLASKDPSGLQDIQNALKTQQDQRKSQLGVAYYYIKINELTEAENIVKPWLEQDPNDSEANLLKAIIDDKKGLSLEAETRFKQVLVTEPSNQAALVALGQIYARRELWQDAYQYAVQAQNAAPELPATHQLLLISAKQLDKLNEVNKLLDMQISTNPDSMVLTHVKARALALNGDSNSAINLLESMPSTSKNEQTWSTLGDIYYAQNSWIDSERAYQEWLRLAPLDINAHLRVIHLSEKTDKIRQGIKLAEDAAKIFPNDVRFSIVKAGLLFKLREYGQSQTIVDKLPSEVKATPHVINLQGYLHLATQNLKAALETYQLKYQKSPSVGTANELASVYLLNEQPKEAIDFLTSVIKEYPSKAKPLELKLADILAREYPDRAIEQYLVIVEHNPNNALAMNNLAWLYFGNGQLENAQKYAEKAHQLSKGETPEINDTYGYILFKSGELSESLVKLKLAYEQKSSDAEIALHYAECLIANSALEQAKEVLALVETEDPTLLTSKAELEKRLD